MRPIFLIGYMCSGKTTLGQALSRALQVPFVDLDHWVESRAQLSVAQIFDKYGEDGFRIMEMEALQQLCDSLAVVACGGGTPCLPGAMELMNSHGITVWLQPNAERLLSRLMDGRASRPLISEIQTREEMARFAGTAMRTRFPYYSQSLLQFDSSFLESKEEIEVTVEKLAQLLLAHLR